MVSNLPAGKLAHMHMLSISPILIGIASMSVGCGQGPSQAPQHVILQLDWLPTSQFVGVLQAEAQGFFVEEGLSVELRSDPGTQQPVVDLVARAPGLAFGCSESSVLLRARAAGEPVLAVGTMLRSNPIGWLSMAGANITSAGQMRGKRVGIHLDGVAALYAALAFANVAVTEVDIVYNASYDLGQVVNGSLDALQGYSITDMVELGILTRSGARFASASSEGYKSYDEVLFTTESKARLPGAALGRDRLLRALRRGWQFAYENQNASAVLIHAHFEPDKSLEYAEASVAATLQLAMPTGSHAMASMDRKIWEADMSTLVRYGALSKPVDLAQFLSFAPATTSSSMPAGESSTIVFY